MGIDALYPSYRISPRDRLHRALELLAELGEFVGGDVGDRPVVQPALAPASDIEALERLGPRRAALGARGLRHEQIDQVQAAAVDDGADGAGVRINQPAPR